ncbi:MAG: ABC transporter permease subunit [Lachnospiraceae bacterium]
MALPTLISGSFIVETIFAIPGLGSLGTDAIMKNDYPILMAATYVRIAFYATLTGFSHIPIMHVMR